MILEIGGGDVHVLDDQFVADGPRPAGVVLVAGHVDGGGDAFQGFAGAAHVPDCQRTDLRAGATEAPQHGERPVRPQVGDDHLVDRSLGHGVGRPLDGGDTHQVVPDGAAHVVGYPPVAGAEDVDAVREGVEPQSGGHEVGEVRDCDRPLRRTPHQDIPDAKTVDLLEVEGVPAVAALHPHPGAGDGGGVHRLGVAVPRPAEHPDTGGPAERVVDDGRGGGGPGLTGVGERRASGGAQ